MKTCNFVGPIMLLVVFLAGCSGGKSDDTGTSDKEYDFKGTIVKMNDSETEPKVIIKHEDIPGLNMRAMTMTFNVEDAKFLDGIHDGDQVQGKVKKMGSSYLITKMEKLPASP